MLTIENLKKARRCKKVFNGFMRVYRRLARIFKHLNIILVKNVSWVYINGVIKVAVNVI